MTTEEFGVFLSEIEAKEILVGMVAYFNTLAIIDARKVESPALNS